jgi:hypothetical protein
MDGIVSHVAGSIFLLILVFLIVTNYRGMVAIMSQGGTTLNTVTKTLQGR